MLGIWAPLAAVMCSPPFLAAVPGMIRHPAQIPIQMEVIRRATPLWTNLVNLYTTALYHAGVSSRPQAAVVGKDGWAFLGDAFNMSFSQSIRRRVLTDEQAARWAEAMKLQAEWLGRRGIPVFYVVAPSPSSIYPEFLPDWTRSLLDRPTTFDKILAAGRDLPIIDLRSALIRQRTVAATYSRLNTHWTEFGAWVAWQQIAPKLAAAVPGLHPFGVGDLLRVDPVRDCTNEYEFLIGIVACDTRNHPRLKQPWPEFEVTSGAGARPEKYPGDTIIDDNRPRETLNTSASNRMTLLFLRDSMGHAISPFVQASFYKTVHVHHFHAHRRLPDLIERHKPAAVLYVVTERAIDPYVTIGQGGDDDHFWRNLNAFDALSSDGELTWTTNGGEGIHVEGGRDLTRPAVISWGGRPGSERAGILKFRLKAPGEDALAIGVVRLEYRTGGRTERQDEHLDAGQNELYFDVPAGAEGEKVTAVADVPSAGDVTLESVTLRFR